MGDFFIIVKSFINFIYYNIVKRRQRLNDYNTILIILYYRNSYDYKLL